jgi:zinc transport system substrate-binding protein
MRTISLVFLATTALACSGSKKDDAPVSAGGSQPATRAPGAPAPLRIGVTMHPYYSWTANVVAGLPDITVVPILPGEIDAGDYQPTPDDITKIRDLDAIVINGIGHDDFIGDMVKASGNDHLTVVAVNTETPTVPFTHGNAPNSHTFISFTNAMQETGYIARKLGELRPTLAGQLAANAEAYTARLRAIRAATTAKLASAKVKRVVTVHDGYVYLLHEFGVELAGVVQPAHGLTPSAAELSELIDLMKRERVTVVFTEETFPDRLLTTLREATGARVYIISHVAVGTYSADEYEQVMQRNANVLVRALVTDPT